MPRTVFKRVYKLILTGPFLLRKVHAFGTRGIHLVQRITAVMRMMAYGVAADTVGEYCRLSSSSEMESMKEFTREWLRNFERNICAVLRPRIYKGFCINASRGFPGIVTSIDCQHYECKSGPTHLAGAHNGKNRKLTMVLESLADGEGWLWFMYFEFPGSMDDINVLDKSPTMAKILSTSFPRAWITFSITLLELFCTSLLT